VPVHQFRVAEGHRWCARPEGRHDVARRRHQARHMNEVLGLDALPAISRTISGCRFARIAHRPKIEARHRAARSRCDVERVTAANSSKAGTAGSPWSRARQARPRKVRYAHRIPMQRIAGVVPRGVKIHVGIRHSRFRSLRLRNRVRTVTDGPSPGSRYELSRAIMHHRRAGDGNCKWMGSCEPSGCSRLLHQKASPSRRSNQRASSSSDDRQGLAGGRARASDHQR